MIIPILCVAALAGTLGLYFLISDITRPQDPEFFHINATYADGVVHVHFFDQSERTEYVIMEIQGMAETLQRTYDGHSFYDTVILPAPPQYGWGVHPIILDIQHETLGQIRMKTEIREAGQGVAPVIFVR